MEEDQCRDTSGFLLPLFYCRISATFPMKKGSFFPKIGQIIPKLIGVIVGKNPDLVTACICPFYF
jgi:hypothetical protein